ncbi:MAG: nucleotide exchange factor GrpE [Candidatus Thorarchaeota archaeon]
MGEKKTKTPNNSENDYLDIDEQIEQTEATPSQETSKSAERPSEPLLAEIKELYEKLEEKDDEYNKLHRRYLRALADYENLKKRSQAEQARLLKQANENLLLKLLNIAHSFQKAETSWVKDQLDLNEILTGFQAIHKQFQSLLKNEGVKPIQALGEKFDPNLHEVVSVRSSSEEEDTILEEIETGYMINSSLLRPAKVIIAKQTQEP